MGRTLAHTPSCSAPPSDRPYLPCRAPYEEARSKSASTQTEYGTVLRGLVGEQPTRLEISASCSLKSPTSITMGGRHAIRGEPEGTSRVTRDIFWKNVSAVHALSHKDRFRWVRRRASHGALGCTGIIGASTVGNHGIAGAAYATIAGLKSLMFYPPGGAQRVPALDVAVRRTRGC